MAQGISRQTAVIAVVAVALLSATALIVFRRPGLPADEVVRRMSAASLDVKTFAMTLSFEAQLDLTKSPRMKQATALLLPSSSSVYGVATDGAYDLTDPDHPRFSQKFGFYKRDGNQRIEAEFEALGTGGEYFARLTRAPLLPMPVDLNALAGKWVALGSALSTVWDPAEEAARLRENLSSSTLLRVTKTFPVASLEGIPTYHYEFELDGKMLMDKLRRATGVTERQANAEKDLSNFLSLNKITGEIWIGKSDFRPRRVTAVIPFVEDDVEYGTGRLQMTFSAFNEPVAVEKPASAVTLEELVRSVFNPAAFVPTGRIDITSD